MYTNNMADEDEIDILGDFTINSNFSGTNRDSVSTLHPESSVQNEMTLHGFAVPQDVQGKVESHGEMEMGQGVHLNFTAGLNAEIVESCEEYVPNFIREEILIDTDVPDSIQRVMSMVNTGRPTVSAIAVYSSKGSRNIFKNKISSVNKSKFSLLKPDIFNDTRKPKPNHFDISNIADDVLYYGDDLLIGSTESVGGTDDSLDDEIIPETGRSVMPKVEKKAGNHRRKYTTSSSSTGSKSGKTPSKFNISMSMKKKISKKAKEVPARSKGGKSDSGGEATRSPKLQIVFSSGQALPVSEGEQVIKIEKKKRADSESDVEINIDSDDNTEPAKPHVKTEERLDSVRPEVKTSLVQRKFEPVRPRQRKVNLDGDGGCTIMHTESGDLIEVVPEPRPTRERAQRRQPIQLFHCKLFSAERPTPYSVRLLVSALVLMDAHAHTSRAEVMGLLGGELRAGVLHVRAYRPCAAAASHTHCDMCPVSQARAAEALNSAGHAVVGWHHSHPRFVAQPSELDLKTQLSLQVALERHDAPFIALITSQHWPRGRVASHYRCLRVEQDALEYREVGYQFSVKLIPDLTAQSVADFLAKLREVACENTDQEYVVNMAKDVCPDAGVTYLEKCVSSVSQHLTSAGYSERDLTFKQVVKGIRDIFR